MENSPFHRCVSEQWWKQGNWGIFLNTDLLFKVYQTRCRPLQKRAKAKLICFQATTVFSPASKNLKHFCFITNKRLWSHLPTLCNIMQLFTLPCAQCYSVVSGHLLVVSALPLQYGLRWLKSFSLRWGLGSRWDHLLAFYVTPTSRFNAFLNV